MWPGEGETWLTMVNPWATPLVLTLTVTYDDIGERQLRVEIAPRQRWALPLSHMSLRGDQRVTYRINAGIIAQCDADCSLLVTNWFGVPGAAGAFATTYEPRPLCP